MLNKILYMQEQYIKMPLYVYISRKNLMVTKDMHAWLRKHFQLTRE